MPKVQEINPQDVRKKSQIKFAPIPINQYQKTVADEQENYSRDDFLRIYRDMCIIREFESMLNSIKVSNEYNGIEYNHPGPAHLSIGQEAAAVGMAYNLNVDDYIFGSHRSHGEILAKGLSAIHKLDDKTLRNVMETYHGGRCLQIVAEDNDNDLKSLAVDFLVYGTLAEIFARDTGFNKGLGGSMHAFFLPFGVYPNNAIVGGSSSIAVGGALYKHVNQKPGIVVANIGDASMGCGPVWEGIVFAAMDQYKQLWEGDYQGGLPIIFNFMNNQYGMGGQTSGETMGYDILARVGAGVNPEQMHAERVDGYNPLAVIDTFKRKKALLQDKKGPVLLDTLTYRFSGHSPSDASSYRTKDEIEAWQEADSIVAFGQEIVEADIASEDDLDGIRNQVKEIMTRACRLATDDDVSPHMDLVKQPELIGDFMFSNDSADSMAEDREPEVTMPIADNPRAKQLARKQRFGLKEDGKPVSKARVFQLRDALFEAILDRFYKDPTLVAYGEENRDWGGAFAVYRGLTEALPYHRLFNALISEGAIVGTAVGYGMCGGRVLAEIMYCDFLGRCGDEIFNQLSKWQGMSGGEIKMPAVIRVSVGSKYGAQHSQDFTSLVAHIPGLKVAFPATPYDAKGLMNAALQGTDPVIFFESQRIYDIGEYFHEGGVPQDYYEVAIGEPDVKRTGDDITILTIGATLYRALEAADELQDKYGLSAEVIDARSIVPFQYEKVLESVKKTGRIVLASDAVARGSILNDMAQNIADLAFDDLDGPPVVVGSRNWITPAYELENYFFPQKEWILDAIHERIVPLDGHQVTTNWTEQERLRRARLGV